MFRNRCPKCALTNKDRSNDNLANYKDGHSYCYSCHYYKQANDLQTLKNKLKAPQNVQSHSPHIPMLVSPHPDNMLDYDIPAKARLWLDKYGITKEEIVFNGLWYDLVKDLLVFPIYDGVRLVCTNGRYFGSDTNHPKYVTRGSKSAYFKLFPKESNVYVLVEDFVSAIKVGRQYNCIPLLGSTIPDRLLLSLIPSNPVLRIWLDPDKITEAMKESEHARQWHPSCATIITEMDPKDYTDEGIKDEVESTI